MQKHPEFYQLLLEYFHSTLPIKFPSFQDLLNPRFIEKSNQQLQSTNNSFFLPVSIFLADLNSNYYQIMSGGMPVDASGTPGAASPLVSPRTTAPAIFLSSSSGGGNITTSGGIPIFATQGQHHSTSGLASSGSTAVLGSAASSAGASSSPSPHYSIFSRPPPPPPPPPTHPDAGQNLNAGGMYATSVIRKVGFVNEHLMQTIQKAFERSQPAAPPTAAVTYNKKKPT